MISRKKAGFLATGFAIAALSAYDFYQKSFAPIPPKKLPYSAFVSKIKSQELSQIVIENRSDGIFVEGKESDGSQFETLVPQQENVANRLIEAQTSFNVKNESPLDVYKLLKFSPYLFMFGLLLYIVRRVSPARNKMQRLKSDSSSVKFDDVQGIDEAKREIQEIVDYLKDPAKYKKAGAKISGGTLLIGPPGTGKTLLARAVAGEANVPFYSVSGSDFNELYVGTGLKRVKEMFAEARKNAPCIIFIDEIDALASKRDNTNHNEYANTLIQLLVEMDGIGKDNDGVIVLASTNRPDALDPAVTRPGRFNRQIVVPMPDLTGRLAILKVHTAHLKLASDISLENIARSVPGFSGAQLANLANEAAIMTARRNDVIVSQKDFDNAKDRIVLGLESSHIITEEEKRITAYHEAGHAYLKLNLPGCDPLDKVTIIPRGLSMGVTVGLPETDHHNYTKQQLLDRITELYGGRIAEEIVFGPENITTGAANDIEKATQLAFYMVSKFGMSSKVGLVNYFDSGMPPNEAIITEVEAITKNCAERARSLLQTGDRQFRLLAEDLLKKETMSAAEIKALLNQNNQELAPELL